MSSYHGLQSILASKITLLTRLWPWPLLKKFGGGAHRFYPCKQISKILVFDFSSSLIANAIKKASGL